MYAESLVLNNTVVDTDTDIITYRQVDHYSVTSYLETLEITGRCFKVYKQPGPKMLFPWVYSASHISVRASAIRHTRIAQN